MNTAKDIHIILFKLLAEFIRVSSKYNLEWYLDGGALLGTYRNHRLIDWDDDIDIAMPRSSYNKFIKLAKEFKEPFFLQTCETDPEYFSISPKLRYSSSTLLTIPELDFKYNKGVCIDILPLDHIPESEEILNIYKDYTKLVVGRCSMRFKTNKEVNELFLSHKIDMKSIYHSWNEIMTIMDTLYKDSKYVASSMCWWSSKYRDIILESKWYQHSHSYLIDENNSFLHVNIPLCSTEVLTAWYGKDFKTPRNEDSGHSYLHTFLYDANHSYKEYEKLDKNTLINMIEKGETL